MLSVARAESLSALLLPLEARCDVAARIAADPVEAPRSFAAPADQEVAGLIAAALAYGRADLFKPKLFGVLGVMGPSPSAFARAFDPRRQGHLLAPFAYRFHLPGDLGALLSGIGSVLRTHGSLGEAFRVALATHGSLQPALGAFARELREEGRRAVGDSLGPIRALEHLLPDAARGSACKRLLLYLRWMVRRDQVDLGSWEGLVPRSALVIPLDTHIMRISRLLGLTARSDLSWRTAEEITGSLRRIDPGDPVRFDFPLCHLGMSGACPARRSLACCRRCPLRSGCAAGRRLLP